MIIMMFLPVVVDTQLRSGDCFRKQGRHTRQLCQNQGMVDRTAKLDPAQCGLRFKDVGYFA